MKYVTRQSPESLDIGDFETLMSSFFSVWDDEDKDRWEKGLRERREGEEFRGQQRRKRRFDIISDEKLCFFLSFVNLQESSQKSFINEL